jgi:multiple sugar transport system ATP-binding protein
MENPASVFVAGFLGLPPMNLLPGGSVSGNKLILDDDLIPLSGRVYPLVQNGQRVMLGFRREVVHISASESFDGRIHLKGEVEALEPDYAQRTQTVYIRNGRLGYSGSCAMDVKIEIGQMIHVAIDPEKLYFFDSDSGRRL